MTKGARVYIEGRLTLDEWTNAEGVQKRGLSVMSWHARLSEIGRAKPAPARKPKPAAANGEPFHSDPIGF
jgi:single-stranded DNA-binding protein